MIWLKDNIRSVLWVAVLPGFIAVFLLIFTVHEPEHLTQPDDSRNHLTVSDITRLPGPYWFVVALGAVFTLARFSEAFLILRAQEAGLTIGYVPLIIVVMNVFYSLFAYPAGAASDRFSAWSILLLGFLILIIADIILALAVYPWVAFVGAAFWGLHMAATQGLLSKLIADNSPGDIRGTAFGVFNLICGISTFMASYIAGVLWTAFGASATFYSGAFFVFLAIIWLLFYRSHSR